MLKNIWNDPVWSKVIASAIVAIAGAALVFATGSWSTIRELVNGLVSFFSTYSSIPNWLIGVAGFTTLIALIIIFRALIKTIFTPNQSEPEWISYTTDIFMGLRWRWKYIDGEFTSPAVFCPNCDFQLIPKSISDFGSYSYTKFNCDNCNAELPQEKGSYSEIQQIVSRKIHLKIRNDTWKPQPKT